MKYIISLALLLSSIPAYAMDASAAMRLITRLCPDFVEAADDLFQWRKKGFTYEQAVAATKSSLKKGDYPEDVKTVYMKMVDAAYRNDTLLQVRQNAELSCSTYYMSQIR